MVNGIITLQRTSETLENLHIVHTILYPDRRILICLDETVIV